MSQFARSMPWPSRLKAPGVIGLALAGAFFGISRTSGSGWATVLVAVLLGGVVVGSLGPAVAILRAGVRLDPPIDAIASRPVPLTLVARPSVTIMCADLDPSPMRCPTGSGVLPVHPPKRGVYAELHAVVRSTWPLGIAEWRCMLAVSLAEPLHVGPLPAHDGAIDSPLDIGRGDEDTRGVRGYVPGDSQRVMHWPATARAGQLMVRETDGPTSPPVVIPVDLNGTPEAAELAASRAAAAALAALQRGSTVRLLTVEADGPRSDLVGSPRDVSRRLARAVPGMVPTAVTA